MSKHALLCEGILVPLAGIEPALLAELDFESSASTNSATGAFHDISRKAEVAKPAEYSGRALPVNPRVSELTRSQMAVAERLGPGRTRGSSPRCSGRGNRFHRASDLPKTLQCDRASPRQRQPRGIGRFHTGDERDV